MCGVHNEWAASRREEEGVEGTPMARRVVAEGAFLQQHAATNMRIHTGKRRGSQRAGSNAAEAAADAPAQRHDGSHGIGGEIARWAVEQPRGDVFADTAQPRGRRLLHVPVAVRVHTAAARRALHGRWVQSVVAHAAARGRQGRGGGGAMAEVEAVGGQQIVHLLRAVELGGVGLNHLRWTGSTMPT